jgi:hypothetical protein
VSCGDLTHELINRVLLLVWTTCRVISAALPPFGETPASDKSGDADRRSLRGADHTWLADCPGHLAGGYYFAHYRR